MGLGERTEGRGRRSGVGVGRQKSERLPGVQSLTNVAWEQINLKCPSNIFLQKFFLQEMANFNPNSFWNNVFVQNKTVEKYSNVHSLVKPIE